MTSPEPRAELIPTGETFPDFTLSTQDREDWSLADAVKKSDVVLCFFPFAFTGVCGTEMECLSKEIKRWTDAGATPVGISCDSFAALKAWAEKEGYTNTMLSDIHRTVCKAAGLYWSELNVAQRGTIVLAQSEDGVATVKWSQAREPGEAMDLDQVLASMA